MLMQAGHYDYGNGYHGRAYLNPHQLFLHPSTIWRLAQDLLDVLPGELLERTEVVAGPATGGALLAHTLAGLLDGRRALTHPPAASRRSRYVDGELTCASFYASHLDGRRVLLADDVRNTGATFERCATLVRRAGGTVIGTVEICDRLEAVADARRAELRADRISGAGELSRRPSVRCASAGEPITTF